MPYKNKEDGAKCKRRWYDKNLDRERIRTKRRTLNGEWKTEERRRKSREYYQQNKDKIREQFRQYYRNNLEREKLRHQRKALKRRYGITVEQRDAMFAKFDGKCWCCKEEVAEMIDHNHETNEVRGALCLYCNCAIGYFKDDTGRMLKAIQYLTSGKEG